MFNHTINEICRLKGIDLNDHSANGDITDVIEGGDFYITEGEGYNMITRKLPLRRCFIDEENKMMVGKELTKLKSDQKYSINQIPEFGKGLAVSELIRKYRYKN